MDKESHLETINKVKEYINEKDYDSLKSYIERREIEIRLENDITSEYIDELVKDLI